jgi:hypothetical protein
MSEPTKEFFRVEVENDVLQGLADVLSEKLFNWKEFPIELPQTDFPEPPVRVVNDEEEYYEQVRLDEPYQDPWSMVNEELDEAARNANGSSKKLSAAQLAQIKRDGTFTVPSAHFTDKEHKWELSHFLQKGSAACVEDLQQSVRFSVRQLVYENYQRVLGRGHFSIYGGVRTCWRALNRIFEPLIGYRAMRRSFSDSDVDAKVTRARSLYVVKRLEATGQGNLYRDKKTGIEFDLSLYNDDARRNVSTILGNFRREWPHRAMELKYALLRELQEQGLEGDALQRELADRYVRVTNDEMLKYLREANANGNGNGKGNGKRSGNVAHVFAQHIEAAIAFERVSRAIEQEEADERERLRSVHKLGFFGIREWNEINIEKQFDQWKQARQRSVDERLEAALQAYALESYCYQRYKRFDAKHAAAMRHEFATQRQPAQVFTTTRYIWRPSHWIIRKTGDSYYAETSSDWSVTTRFPFWRWSLFAMRSIVYTSNVMLALSAPNVWLGPFGVKALLLRRPFKNSVVVNAKTGAIEYASSTTATLWHRLSKIWESVFESRRRFEAAPDIGIIGRGLTRQFSRLWNYLFKGALGSLLVLVVQPLFTALNVVLSTVLFFTAFLWVPAVLLVFMLIEMILYDFDSPYGYSHRQIPLIRIVFSLAHGLLTTVGSVAGVAVHTLIAVIVSLFGFVTYASRRTYDNAIHFVVLKRQGRVPRGNNFLVRRVSGPGVSYEFFYQIKLERAIVQLQVALEQRELEFTLARLRKLAKQPQINFTQTVNALLRPVCGSADTDSKIAQDIWRRCDLLERKILRAERRRRAAYPVIENQYMVRLDRPSLNQLLRSSVPLVEQFYRTRIFPHMSEAELVNFWFDMDCLRDDFELLARKIYANQVFSEPFVTTPLDEDMSCVLKVQHFNLDRYSSMISRADLHDPLDRVTRVTLPESFHSAKEPTAGLDMLVENAASSQFHAWGINLAFEGFQATSIVMSAPAQYGHGIAIRIVGKKSRDFQIQHAQMIVKGEGFWSELGNIVGQLIVSGIKGMPIALTPLWMEPNDFRYGKRKVDTTIRFGTGAGGSWIKFKDETLLNTLRNLRDRSDPELTLVLEYGSMQGTFVKQGELVSVAIRPSKIIQALETGENVFVPPK